MTIGRRTFVKGVALAGATLGGSLTVPQATASEGVGASTPTAATALRPWAGFGKAYVINGNGGLENPNAVTPESSAPPTHLYQSFVSQVDERALRDAKASGVTAITMTLGHVFGFGEPFEVTVQDFVAWDAFIGRHPRDLVKVGSAADIVSAKKTHRIGLIYGLQNTTAFGDDLDRIGLLRQMGLRVAQLTYNTRNAVGDGATVPDDRGLTPFGASVVERLQAERILVDLSHSSEATCLNALALARRPMVISHGGCRAVADHPRNKTDAELRRLSACGGMIGIYFMPYLRLAGQPYAADMLAHLEHAIDVCGEDHVGIGTDGEITPHDDVEAYRREIQADMDERRKLGIGAPGETADAMTFLPDLCGVDQFSRLAALLAERGHGDARIGKILGGNFERVMREAWA